MNFYRNLQEKMSALKLGDPMDLETQLGPLSSEDALNNYFKTS